MVRPQSIVRYERFYLTSFVLGLVVSALTWSGRAAVMARQPILAGQTWPLWLAVILGIVVSLTLWYFTARTPSVVAKWIVVVFAGFGAIGILTSIVQIATGRIPIGVPTVVGLADHVLYIAAAVLLFRRDATAWFDHTVRIAEPLA